MKTEAVRFACRNCGVRFDSIATERGQSCPICGSDNVEKSAAPRKREKG